MVELKNDGLVFTFPEVHPDAKLCVQFQRTLRIPDNGKTYPLPPSLGAFPMRHVDDHAASVPPAWSAHGGVMLPMYQSEALWIHFDAGRIADRDARYPFAVKIAAGKINAVTGGAWTNDLQAQPQDYAVVPAQPWLDGFAVGKGVIRQFVAMPLGSGYSAEEQVTGRGEHGGIQILVRPMKRDEFERRFPKRPAVDLMDTGDLVSYCRAPMDMGLAPGGRMKQEIFEDPYGVHVWDAATRSRSFVHVVNTLVWEAVTGEKPPLPPITAAHYSTHNLPWFEYYADGRPAVDGSEALARLRSVIEVARAKGDMALPENEDAVVERVIRLGSRARGEVRDGAY